jgi:hypothetical protein
MAKSGLNRLAKLYGMVEGLTAMQARMAAGAVFEMDQAEARLAERQKREQSEGRAGIARGSRIEALAAERSVAVDASRREWLAQMKIERERLYALAVEAHRESRMESRQIDGMLSRKRVAEEIESGRRTQNAADDRYLSRREWLRTKELREGSLHRD